MKHRFQRELETNMSMHLKASDATPSLIERLDDLIASRWTVQILRVLAVGPARFSGLRRAIPRVSANVLAARLRQMEVVGLIQRAIMPAPAGCQVYQLTNAGAAAKGLIKAIDVWAEELNRLDISMAGLPASEASAGK